jgi:hypothetical protein
MFNGPALLRLAFLGLVSAVPLERTRPFTYSHWYDDELALLELSLANGIDAELDPYPALGKPRLTFKPDGTFKITVFSDLHFGENPWDDWGPQQDVNSLKLMNKILPDEKPDYA